MRYDCNTRGVTQSSVDCEQVYIPHGYKELSIPPITSHAALDLDHLHIWPRHSFMMIALPNADRSFTGTLFMPYEKFSALGCDRSAICDFFSREAGDLAVSLGEKLAADYLENPIGALVTVKVACWVLPSKRVEKSAQCLVLVVPRR